MGKPVELWFFFGSLAAGVIMYLLPKTPSIVIGCLVVIFILLLHPIWNFWWIEQSIWLRLSAIFLLASSVCFLGYFVYPKTEVGIQTKILKKLSQIKQPDEIAAEVIKKLPIEIGKNAPPMVNLKQRAIDLSNEILRVYEQDAHPDPNHYELPMVRARRQSNLFMFRFYEKVLVIRDEFNQQNYKEQSLDNILKRIGETSEQNKQFQGHPELLALEAKPSDIEEVANRLKSLAEYIKEGHFSITLSPPQRYQDSCGYYNEIQIQQRKVADTFC